MGSIHVINQHPTPCELCGQWTVTCICMSCAVERGDPVDVAGWLHGIADKERGKKSRMLRSLIRSLADAYEREFGKRGEPVNGPGQPSHEALVELLEAARRNHLCHKQDEIRLCNYWSCKVLARCETEAKGER